MNELACTVLVVCGSAALLFLILIFTWFLDRSPRESFFHVGFFFVWGLVTGGLSIRFTEFLTRIEQDSLGAWAVMLWPGLVILTPIIVMAVSFRAYDCPADGFVYGCAVGLGFFGGALVACRPLCELSESYGPSALLVGVTAIVLCGSVVGFTSMSHRKFAKYGLGILGVASAMTIVAAALFASRMVVPHVEWWIPGLSALILVALVVVVYGVEHRVISKVVEEEVALNVLPEWTTEVIGSYWKRIRGNWWPLLRERTVISRTISRLAFRKRALRDLSEASGDVAWLEIVLLRKEIVHIFESHPEEPE